jgi:hypothetical protein
MEGEGRISRKDKTMKQENRVLGRIGARELTPREIENVTGAIRTETVCTISGKSVRDGDVFLGEC